MCKNNQGGVKLCEYLVKLKSYTKQTNQPCIVNMSPMYISQFVLHHTAMTHSKAINISTFYQCHIILHFIFFVGVPLNLISKIFFLSFTSLSIIFNKPVRPVQNATFLSFYYFCLVSICNVVPFLLLLSTLHSCWFYSRTWAQTQQIKRTRL